MNKLLLKLGYYYTRGQLWKAVKIYSTEVDLSKLPFSHRVMYGDGETYHLRLEPIL